MFFITACVVTTPAALPVETGDYPPLPEPVDNSALESKLMPPMGIKHAHFAAAHTPLSAGECAAHRAAMHPNGAKALDHIEVLPLPPDGTGPKIMCLSYTYQKVHTTKASAIASTWMTRCDGAVVASDLSDPAVPALKIPHNGEETDNNLWQKTRANFQYLHNEYLDYDFFVFGGDDYYILVNNLRHYLNSEEIQREDAAGHPLYLGHRFAQAGNVNNVFNSGGPSYILNRAALKIYIANINKPFCQPRGIVRAEDVLIAQCLRHSHPPTHAFDTRTKEGAMRFMPFTLGSHTTMAFTSAEDLKAQGKPADWYATYSVWEVKTGFDCCSKYSIGWHYVGDAEMRHTDALLIGCRMEGAGK
jgi:glycoprotein-N-acetylgalactosamine 3-beta-galactosyltransferase